MPQEATILLNKTIVGIGQNRATVPPDSMSVRLEGLSSGGFVELYSVTWGIIGGTNAALDAFDFCPLLILRSETFNPDFNYGLTTVPRDKDVIWQDEIIRDIMFNHRDFHEPMKLTESSNYLIIVPAPTDIAAAATPYDMALTVRGRIFDAQEKPTNIGDRKR